MPNVSKLTLDDITYDVKDANARKYLVQIDEEPTDATKVVIETTDEEIELATVEELNAAITAEASARTAADNTEASTRAAAITAANTRIDNIVAQAGNDNTEIVDARIGTDSHVYASLKSRLDTENSDLKSQIEVIGGISPILRNGSIGNSGNTTNVCLSNVYPVYDAVGLYVQIERNPTAGAHYVLSLASYSVESDTSTTQHMLINGYIFVLDANATKTVIYLPSEAVGFCFDISEVNPDGTVNSLRIADTGTDFVKIARIYDLDRKNRPILRNGTPQSTSNANTVSMYHIQNVDGAKEFRVKLHRDVAASGNYYRLSITFYPISTGESYANRNNTISKDVYAYLPSGVKETHFPVPKGVKGVAVGVTEYTSGGTANALRIANDGSAFIEFEAIYDDANPDYVTTPDFKKNVVAVIPQYSDRGVSNRGDFCIYNGYIYSTEGTKITKQNADLTGAEDTTLALGHGNTIQLGSGNIAYISGWNDSKVYAVNLDTMTIANTYTLPFTPYEAGVEDTWYTNAVVDDASMYAYVLLRSNPDDPFVFCVVDLTTGTVLSRRNINLHGAFQGMDYVDGKIILTYGLGASTPDGIVIMNTYGDILYQYNLSLLNTMEAEGVCADRANGGIYFAAYSTVLYKIV